MAAQVQDEIGPEGPPYIYTEFVCHRCDTLLAEWLDDGARYLGQVYRIHNSLCWYKLHGRPYMRRYEFIVQNVPWDTLTPEQRPPTGSQQYVELRCTRCLNLLMNLKIDGIVPVRWAFGHHFASCSAKEPSDDVRHFRCTMRSREMGVLRAGIPRRLATPPSRPPSRRLSDDPRLPAENENELIDPV